MPKSCLKRKRSDSIISGTDYFSFRPRRKCVAFSKDEVQDIFEVDDWDRTPVKLQKRLTITDIVEMIDLGIAVPPSVMTRTMQNYVKKRRTSLTPAAAQASAPPPPELYESYDAIRESDVLDEYLWGSSYSSSSGFL